MFQHPAMKGPHHHTMSNLERAADEGCKICDHVCRRPELLGIEPTNVSPRDPFLRYHIRRKVSYPPSDDWTVYIEGLRKERRFNEWSSFLTLDVHVCKGRAPPLDYSSFLSQVAEDLDDEPWRMRRPLYPVKDIPRSTGDEATASLAFKWLQTCRLDHGRQCLDSDGDTHVDFMPKRLIAVGDQDVEPKLVVWEDIGMKSTAYATLSHCWGENPSFLTLTSSNIENFKQGINESTLPRSFCDALLTCRRLGIKYIWIDSLCIMQSGYASERDWFEHATDMHLIYRHCELNIAIDHAASPDKGAFATRNPNVLQDCCVWTPLPINCPPDVMDRKWTAENDEHMRCGLVSVDQHTMLTIFTYDQTSTVEKIDYALRGRGWVFQERLMSPRVLHFAEDRIAWECRQSAFNEYLADGRPCGCNVKSPERSLFSVPRTDELNDMAANKPHWWQSSANIARMRIQELQESGETAATIQPNHMAWWECIKAYSKRQLTYPDKDKLVAFASIPKSFADQFHSNYSAGFFQIDLPAGLLWTSQDRTRRRALNYRAPSWSWASLDGEVTFNIASPLIDSLIDPLDTRSTVLSKVYAVMVDLVNPNDAFGQIRSASLQVAGQLEPIQLSTLSSIEVDYIRIIRRLGSTWFIYYDDVEAREIIDPHREIYLLPAVKYPATDRSSRRRGDRYDGLVLEKVKETTYTRIGVYSLTTIPREDSESDKVKDSLQLPDRRAIEGWEHILSENDARASHRETITII